MEKRPQIKLALSLGDIFFEMLGWALLITTWILILYHYDEMPDIIATHFNAMGEINDYGSKSIILPVPIISSIIFLSLTLVNRKPHTFHYPVPLDDDNIVAQYTSATRNIRYLKSAIAVTFLLLVIMMIPTAKGHVTGLTTWLLPGFLVLLFGGLIYYCTRIAFKRIDFYTDW